MTLIWSPSTTATLTNFPEDAAPLVLHDEKAGRRHFEHEAEPRQRADRAPHRQTVGVAPDAKVNASGRDGGCDARERGGLERQRVAETQRLRRLLGRDECQRDARNVPLFAPQAGPECRLDDGADRVNVGQRRERLAPACVGTIQMCGKVCMHARGKRVRGGYACPGSMGRLIVVGAARTGPGSQAPMGEQCVASSVVK